MQRQVPKSNWGNELEFLSWDEFKQMAPTILQLEATRIGKLIQGAPEDTDFHNSLVRARFAVTQFIACLEQADRDTFEKTCSAHLRTALLSMSSPPASLDTQRRKTHSYILDRLNYVNYRIGLIY